MKRFPYLLSRIRRMNVRRFWEAIVSVSEITGKSRLAMALDMGLCAWKYGAGYMDYQLFELYRLNDAQRATYLTRGRNNELVRRYNKPENYRFFDDKREFYWVFHRYLRREWVWAGEVNREKVLKFASGHEEMIVKPIDGCCGRNVRKVTREEVLARPESFSGLLLEERIHQHSRVNSLHPDSVNTVRIVTIRKDGLTHIICAYLRIGNGGEVDNFNHGGMTAPVELTTGRVTAPAVNKEKEVFSSHPLTGVTIEGFLLPDWEMALDLVREAAEVVPGMGYIGWDVAFSEDGPLIVEENNFPGHDIYQLPAHTPDGIGVWSAFQV